MKIEDIKLINASSNLSTDLPLYLGLLSAFEPSTKDTLESAIWDKARFSKTPPDLAKLTHDIVMYKLENAIVSAALIKYQAHYNKWRAWKEDVQDDDLEVIFKDDVSCFSQDGALGIFINYRRVYSAEDIENQLSKVINSFTIKPAPVK